MLAQQHHLHLPRNKQVKFASPQPLWVGVTRGRQVTNQPLPCGAYQYAALSHKKTSLSATAEQANPAVSEAPSDWREPLDPMLWHVSHLCLILQCGVNAVCSWVHACREPKVKLESVSQQIWHLLGRLVHRAWLVHIQHVSVWLSCSQHEVCCFAAGDAVERWVSNKAPAAAH